MKVYIVMSTNDHESEYTVHECHASETKANYYADGLLADLEESYLDDLKDDPDFETGWHVWIEEREMVE